MDTTTKVVLIMLTVGGVAMFLCCGGLMVGGWCFACSVSQSITMNPVDVRAATDEIVTIDIPDGFEPKQSMRMDMLGMKMAIYGRPDAPNAVILIMQNRFAFDVNDEQQRKQMFDAMRQQAGLPAGQEGASTSETRDIEIDGQEVPFQFTTLDQNGQKVRQVMGFVPLKSGMVMIMIMVPEEQYDEDQIVAMLESIREPQVGTGPSLAEPAIEVEAEDLDDHEARHHAPDPDAQRQQSETSGDSAVQPATSEPGERPNPVPVPN
ncbi:MAG: hypothetical protein EHM42_10200 [Planctomycetaceae bacterium]|nr:MAG: hypothetical protein EHM42_10200 [Planctomycetaceae bacterium]